MSIRILILLLLITTPLTSYGKEIGLIIGSKHFDTKKDYNESNPGLYYRDKKYIMGSYKNSFSELAVFAGKVSGHRISNRVRAYVGYGLVYGYGWDGKGMTSSKRSGRKIVPFVLPTLSIGGGNDLYFNLHVIGSTIAWSFSKTF